MNGRLIKIEMNDKLVEFEVSGEIYLQIIAAYQKSIAFPRKEESVTKRKEYGN